MLVNLFYVIPSNMLVNLFFFFYLSYAFTDFSKRYA